MKRHDTTQPVHTACVLASDLLQLQEERERERERQRDRQTDRQRRLWRVRERRRKGVIAVECVCLNRF